MKMMDAVWAKQTGNLGMSDTLSTDSAQSQLGDTEAGVYLAVQQ